MTISVSLDDMVYSWNLDKFKLSDIDAAQLGNVVEDQPLAKLDQLIGDDFILSPKTHQVPGYTPINLAVMIMLTVDGVQFAKVFSQNGELSFLARFPVVLADSHFEDVSADQPQVFSLARTIFSAVVTQFIEEQVPGIQPDRAFFIAEDTLVFPVNLGMPKGVSIEDVKRFTVDMACGAVDTGLEELSKVVDGKLLYDKELSLEDQVAIKIIQTQFQKEATADAN